MKTGIIDPTVKLVQACTDELLAVTVVAATMASYYVGVVIPIEPMIMVLSYYFVKKSTEKLR